jgi:hypothetical protein
VCGIGFQCSDLTLPVVQPSTYGCPHVLVLSIGDARERHQLVSRRVVDTARGQLMRVELPTAAYLVGVTVLAKRHWAQASHRETDMK